MARATDQTVIYFIAGNEPTEDEISDIAGIEGRVLIRSASYDAQYGATLEACDFVAGSAPDAYLEAYPPYSTFVTLSVDSGRYVTGKVFLNRAVTMTIYVDLLYRGIAVSDAITGIWTFDLGVVPDGEWSVSAVAELDVARAFASDAIYYRTRFITADGNFADFMNISASNYADTNLWGIQDRYEWMSWIVVGTAQANGDVGRVFTREKHEIRGITANPIRAFNLGDGTGHAGDAASFSINTNTAEVALTNGAALTTAGTKYLKLGVSELGDFSDTVYYDFTIRVVSGAESTGTDDASYFYADAAHGGSDVNTGRRPDLPRLHVYTQTKGVPRGKHYFKVGCEWLDQVVTYPANSASRRWFYQYGDPFGVEPIIRLTTSDATRIAYGGSKNITGITKASTAVVTSTSHGFSNGNILWLDEVVGMTEVNDQFFTIANVTTNTYELVGIDSTNFTTYVSGGIAGLSMTTTAAFEVNRKTDSTYQGGSTICVVRGIWFKGGQRPAYVYNGNADIRHCKFTDNFEHANSQGVGHAGLGAPLIFRWNIVEGCYGDSLFITGSVGFTVAFNIMHAVAGKAADFFQIDNTVGCADGYIHYNIARSDSPTSSTKGHTAFSSGQARILFEENYGVANYFYLGAGGTKCLNRRFAVPAGGLDEVATAKNDVFATGYSSEWDIQGACIMDAFIANLKRGVGFIISKVSGTPKRWDLEFFDSVVTGCDRSFKITESWSGAIINNIWAANANSNLPYLSGSYSTPAVGGTYTTIDYTTGNVSTELLPCPLPPVETLISGSVAIHTTIPVGTVLTATLPDVSEIEGFEDYTAELQWRVNKTHVSGATDDEYTVVSGDIAVVPDYIPNAASEAKPFISLRIMWTDGNGAVNYDYGRFPNPDGTYPGGDFYKGMVA